MILILFINSKDCTGKNACKRREIIGDLNANVARSTTGITVKFDVHHDHNRNGWLLAHFCQHKNLIMTPISSLERKGFHGHATYRFHGHRNKFSEINLIPTHRQRKSCFTRYNVHWNLTKLVYGQETVHRLVHFIYWTRTKARVRPKSTHSQRMQSLLSNNDALLAFNASLA